MPTGRKRILFVDDEPMVLEALARMLRQQQDIWEIRFACRAEEALAECKAGPFDAIVLDLYMPDKSGFDLLAEMRASPETADVPIVILTGSNEDPLKRQALDLGAADLLSKPVESADLLARLRSVLRLKEFQDRIRQQNERLESLVRQRTQELENSRLDIIWRLAKAGECRDEATGNHVIRVGHFSRLIAEALRLPADFVEMIFLTSPLHDIGKIGIPDTILRKPGPLAAEEWEVMENHCRIGADILAENTLGARDFLAWRPDQAPSRRIAPNNPFLQMASSIALKHHERWNGKGYPQGLAGDAIPLESRITAVADAYDALRCLRPYKPALAHEAAMEALRSAAGERYDPDVLHACEAAQGEMRQVSDRLTD